MLPNTNMEVLDKLIGEGERLLPTISFVPPPEGVFRTFAIYRTSQNDYYQNWLSSVHRYIKTYYPSDVEDIKEASKKISFENHRKILGILRAIKEFPIEPPKPILDKMNSTNNININNNNNQNNTQQVTLNLFLEAIKDELTGKDFKEVKEILKEFESEPDKTKVKLIEKVKGFGGDVLSNIVANILTNPTIYSGLI